MALGTVRLFDGFYKCDYSVGDVVGRSVIYVSAGKMLGGNSAFAHIGTYREVDGEIIAEVAGQRHNPDPNFRTLYGSDTATINIRGRAQTHNAYSFEGGTSQAPGAVFRAVMTRLDDEDTPDAGAIGVGGIVNGLYSVHLRILDGVDGGLTGVMLLHDGRILGGDAFFYYLGSYTSAAGRWKGHLLNQEHTASTGQYPVFGGHEVGIGFSGTCDGDGAELEAIALAGKRSLRLTAVLKLLEQA
jgi:hypothetical protein